MCVRMTLYVRVILTMTMSLVLGENMSFSYVLVWFGPSERLLHFATAVPLHEWYAVTTGDCQLSVPFHWNNVIEPGIA